LRDDQLGRPTCARGIHLEQLEPRALLSAAYTPYDTIDVTGQVSITRGAITLDPVSGNYTQGVTVTNLKSKAIPEPASLVLDGLPIAPVAYGTRSFDPVSNRTGELVDPSTDAVSPFVKLYDASGTKLKRNQSITVQLTFDHNVIASVDAISYDARVLISNFKVSPLQYSVNGMVQQVGSLDPLNLGNEEFTNGTFDPQQIDLKIANVSRAPVTLDGELPGENTDLFGYQALTSNFLLGYPITDSQEVVYDLSPPPSPTSTNIQFFSNNGGGVGFYDISQSGAHKVLQPGESIELLASVGVEGLIAGVGSPLSTGSLPVTARDGISADVLLPKGPAIKTPLVIKNADKFPAQINLGTLKRGRKVNFTATIYNPNHQTTSLVKFYAAGSDPTSALLLSGGLSATGTPPAVGYAFGIGQSYAIPLSLDTSVRGSFTASLTFKADDGFGHPMPYTISFSGKVV
jgi:hypothetical protein